MIYSMRRWVYISHYFMPIQKPQKISWSINGRKENPIHLAYILPKEDQKRYNYRKSSATSTSLLRKGVIKPKEREPGRRTVEIARFQALKQLRVSTKDFIASENISYE